VMVASAMLCVAGYLLASLVREPIVSLIGCALVGFSVGVFWPGTFSLASASNPKGGTAMFALLALAGDLGCASGPGTVGLVANAAGGELHFGLLVAICFPILMLAGLWLRSHVRERNVAVDKA